VYGILIGASCGDIRLEKEITVNPAVPYNRRITLNSSVAELIENPKGAAFMQKIRENSPMAKRMAESDSANPNPMAEMFAAMMKEIPVRAAGMFSGQVITQEMLDEALR